MALLAFNTNPSTRQLRQFGYLCVPALPLITWLWSFSLTATCWAGGIGGLLGIIGLAAPELLKPVFLGLTLITLPIGMVVGEVAMLLIYFGMFLPLGVLFRILGRDGLGRRVKSRADSYWVKRAAPASVKHYYRQS